MERLVCEIFHVGLTVRHVDWYKEFFVDCLGIQVLSDSGREGDWIDRVTGLPGFKARNVYVTPDGTNRLEMFEIFNPPLVHVSMSLGTYLGVSHVRIGSTDVNAIRERVRKEGLSIVKIPDRIQKKTLIFQDRSGLFWEIVPHDSGGYAVQVVVSDLDRSMEMYAGLLGLNPLDRFDATIPMQDSSGRWFAADAKVQRVGSSCKQVIDLCQYNNFTPLKNPRDTINYMGFHHIAFRVTDASRAFEEIRSKGYRYISEPLHIPEGPNRGGMLFYFYDGDGTVLECLHPPSTNNLT
ncbi:MAG: VOC family protein [Deltaproteobacteria bacterium]|nr:VOC family protein [Deltaproteobacteria bacterium]